MSTTWRTLERLLEPQEWFDRLIARAFGRFGPRLVDLSYANPSDGPSLEVLDVLKRVTSERTGLSLQYTPYGGRTATRRAIAAGLKREYWLPFQYRDIVLTSGAMSGLNIVFRALFYSSSEVLVLTPYWQDYPLYLRNLGIPARFVPLRRDKHLDLDAIAEAIGPRTAGILLSQPCCPTAVAYSPEEITALCTVLRAAEDRLGTKIFLMSDEVHRQLVWGRTPFYSPLRCYPRSVSIYSFGKALSLQGQRIGYVAVSPKMPNIERIRTALERCVRLMGFGSPTSLMQYAICDLLDYQPSLTALAARQACVRNELTQYGYDVCPGDATFYVYVKSPDPDDVRFATSLADLGVAVMPASLFGDPGYFRLSLTARFEAIERALPAFNAALNRA